MEAADPKFKEIDDALAEYYSRLNISGYYDKNGVGVFLNYIKNEELDDPALPIEQELGDSCDAHDCAYSWMSHDISFPIPSYVEIPNDETEAFIFYILQYCYKHSEPPSDEYIKDTIVPKCNEKMNKALAKTTASSKMDVCDHKDNAPVAFTQNLSFTNNDQESNYQTTDENCEGQPPNIRTTTTNRDMIIRLQCSEFQAKYHARAHLNIFTAKELIKELLNIIEEEFKNELMLYYYTDISTALQMNDHQMKEFKISINDNEQKLSVINYDLHLKGRCDKVLYGIVVPNDGDKIQQDKWLWKLDEFLTADGICSKYKITQEELPLSSRQMPSFREQLSQKLVIEESLVDDTNWLGVKQIKSLKRNIKVPKITVTLSNEMWINECKKSFSNVGLPLIPVVVNKNNSHWIEWIKIIKVESQNICVGISCKLNEENKAWTVESICLDHGDIYNKHRLVGLKLDEYDSQMKDFKTSIAEIKFIDNDCKEANKKINVLKQQIKSQQDSIVRLKQSLSRAKNANKYAYGDELENKTSEQGKQLIQEHIKEFIDTMQDDYIVDNGAWLDQIVEDVIKQYDILDFKTNPIGAKRNVYINKQFTKLWMNYVSPRFNNEAMMYYWLDYTTAMQMCQAYSKQYVHKETRKFMVAIINYELKDENDSILYGIILCDDEKLKNKNDKYPYKLKTLMTKEQIKMEYGINEHDLPKQSRKNKEFVNKLLLRRNISKSDLNKINWRNLKLFKSQSANNESINKSVTITQKVVKEYCQIALERLNISNKNANNNNLIPIVVVDKHNSCYSIEWILIVNIIHRNCDIGVSFSYNEKSDTFIATGIYLDKAEIEAKHKLIGLKFNYCKHLRPFSLRKFKFKSDKHSIIDDDAENEAQVKQIQRQIMQYKQGLQAQQTTLQQLHAQMQQAQNMYANLKYQSDQCILQQQMPAYQYATPYDANLRGYADYCPQRQ